MQLVPKMKLPLNSHTRSQKHHTPLFFQLKLDCHLSKIFVLFDCMKALRKMKNVFYFILKALFVLKVFKCLSWLFGRVEKTSWLGLSLENYKSNNTRRHKTTQHNTSTTWHKTSATLAKHDTTRVKHNVSFILIY